MREPNQQRMAIRVLDLGVRRGAQARPLISDHFGRASSMIPAGKRGNPAAHGVDGDRCGGAPKSRFMTMLGPRQ